MSCRNYTADVLRRLDLMGGRDAIVMGNRRISGTEAHDTILRFARTLRDSGLEPGDRVALFVSNSPEALLLEPAVHFAGCGLVFVPPEPGNSELAAYLQQADVHALIFDPEFEERAGQITAEISVPRAFAIGASSFAPDFLHFVRDYSGLAARDAADGRYIATLMYTGGTTGMPKLVVHGRHYYEALVRVAAALPVDAAADPKALVCTLVTHSSGHNWALAALLSGQAVVLLRAFDAGRALSLMNRERVTLTVIVTPMLYELLDYPDWPEGGFPSLEVLYYIGAAVAPARLATAVERFGPVLLQGYGSTEAGIVSHLMPPEHDLARPESLTSCGRPLPGVEIDLRDEHGQPVPAGQVGELYVRSPTVMDGYWRDPARTAEVLDGDGWFRSGDLARQDEDGYLYLAGRVRDVIVTGLTAGNVYSRLLDDFLLSLPDVKDAAAIGLPGADDRETVHVVLVPRDPASPWDFGQLTRQITEALGDLYAPASYSIAESLPRTVLGKTDKKTLREVLLGTRAGDRTGPLARHTDERRRVP